MQIAQRVVAATAVLAPDLERVSRHRVQNRRPVRDRGFQLLNRRTSGVPTDPNGEPGPHDSVRVVPPAPVPPELEPTIREPDPEEAGRRKDAPIELHESSPQSNAESAWRGCGKARACDSVLQASLIEPGFRVKRRSPKGQEHVQRL
jgi:hypothetical protein